MAGIYLHIPFCKQACHYCDFHFSTSLKNKPTLIEALQHELILRESETEEQIETIYFGGGTPSVLTGEELNAILETIFAHYRVKTDAEITLEANPDDLTDAKIKALAQSPINRLSIGIQSFFEEDLRWMNRAHSADEALAAVKKAGRYFDNISIDLIYGVPGLTDEKWHQNLQIALQLEVPHISSYALTVEPQTALAKMIQRGKKTPVDEAAAKRHYDLLVNTLTEAGFVNYEFSNFGKSGYFSQNNTAYWFGKPYLGIGPSAHGFDGEHRYWNVRHNIKYIKAISEGVLPQERETLTLTDRYNEYIMTRLRTMWGVSLDEIKVKFGTAYRDYFLGEVNSLLKKKLMIQQDNQFHISPSAKFLGDGISAELFYIEA